MGARRNLLYERALALLPGSYKLWHTYLTERTERVLHLLQCYRDEPTNDQLASTINSECRAASDAFEASLRTLYRMPRIWLDYATFLMRLRRITQTRRALDRALRLLPWTLHERIWALYLRLADALETHLPKLSVSIWARYWRVAADPTDAAMANRHLQCLIRCRQAEEATALLVELARNEPPAIAASNDEEGAAGIAPNQYWQRLCQLISQQGALIQRTPVEAVLREAIAQATTKSASLTVLQQQRTTNLIYSTGIFWGALATWHIRQGRLLAARAVYEEAIKTVPTVRDFALVFDSYTKMEETILEVALKGASKRVKRREAAAQGARRTQGRLTKKDEAVSTAVAPNDHGQDSPDGAAMIDEQMARFERLMERRPFLLANVRVRQQPNVVAIWQERIELARANLEGDPDYPTLGAAYEDCLQHLHPARAKGPVSAIWISYATDPSLARDEAEALFRRGIHEGGLTDADDLAALWIAYGEWLAKHRGLEAAVDAVAEAFVVPTIRREGGEEQERDRRPGRGEKTAVSDVEIESVTTGAADEGDQKRTTAPHHRRPPSLARNQGLWTFYLDLEEARGYPEAVRAAYDRVISLGIATPQTFINYALFLGEGAGEILEAFKVYERGIVAFGYPVAFELWNVYLPKFAAYWGERHFERVRDLFEQALPGCPAHLVRALYVAYAAEEERRGNTRHALSILERAVRAISEDQRPALYELLLERTGNLLGLVAQRPIYEEAINGLSPMQAVAFAERYAHLEQQLGETERARAIYLHAASLVDPRTHPAMWAAWQEFESRFGTEATFRDMLRVKRSVTAKFAGNSLFVPATTAEGDSR